MRHAQVNKAEPCVPTRLLHRSCLRCTAYICHPSYDCAPTAYHQQTCSNTKQSTSTATQDSANATTMHDRADGTAAQDRQTEQQHKTGRSNSNPSQGRTSSNPRQGRSNSSPTTGQKIQQPKAGQKKQQPNLARDAQPHVALCAHPRSVIPCRASGSSCLHTACSTLPQMRFCKLMRQEADPSDVRRLHKCSVAWKQVSEGVHTRQMPSHILLLQVVAGKRHRQRLPYLN